MEETKRKTDWKGILGRTTLTVPMKGRDEIMATTMKDLEKRIEKLEGWEEQKKRMSEDVRVFWGVLAVVLMTLIFAVSIANLFRIIPTPVSLVTAITVIALVLFASWGYYKLVSWVANA